jgi:hypothetical protein
MTAGRLAAAKPAATTNTTLYNCPINKAASSVLEVCNQSASDSSYRVALRNYDQILTLDGSSYKFEKGNIVTNYSLVLSPGVTSTSISAGEVITLEDNKGTFRYSDVNVPTNIINYDVKVIAVGNVDIISSIDGNDIAPGDIITGADTGLTAVVYQSSTTSLTLQIDNVLSTDTTILVNTITDLAANDFICFDNEITQITAITGFDATVTRGQIGTTAVEHLPGLSYTAIRETANTTTLSQDITDTDISFGVASAASLNVGTYIRIANELLQITSINGNNIDVTRGLLGTTATSHLTGATLTSYDVIQVGGYIQFFASNEQVSNAAADTVSINATPGPGPIFSPTDKFVYDLGEGTYETTETISLDIGRTVRFLQSDASNAGYTLKLSTAPDGTNTQGGLEFLTGVTINGTAGTAGAYTEIQLTPENVESILQLYTYTDGYTGYGTILAIENNPLYSTIFVYDINADLQLNDSFAFNNVNYTIIGINRGSSGYVMESNGDELKVSFDIGSTTFSNVTTTITGTSGESTIEVTSATGLVPSMLVAGTGIGSGARIESIVGTTVTLTVPNSGAVSGTGTFSHAFNDSPRVPNSVRSLATVSSVSVISDEDYIFYDRSLSANTTHRNTGVVVGPGQSVLVYSTANTISYVLHGFEDSTSDYTPIYYTRESQTTL